MLTVVDDANAVGTTDMARRLVVHGRRAALFATLMLLATACSKPPPAAVAAAPIVSTARPEIREIVEWDEYIGRLESPETVELRARVSGYLDGVHFKEGREVRKGDLLFTIDARPYRAELERAEAEAQRAQTQLELAINDADRAKRLIVTKAISEEEADTKFKSQSVAQAALRSSAAEVTLARLNLEFTEVRAPIDGRIGRALVTTGNLINGSAAGAQATLMTTIVSLDPLYCYGDADELSILKYLQLSREGKRESARDVNIPAELGLADEDGFPHQGYMDFVDNRLDPETGTIRARVVIENTDHRLSPGFYARLRIPGSGKYQATLIPDRAIGADQSQRFVYVIGEQHKVQYRPVTLGPMVDGLRVVKSGLGPADTFIVEGLMRARPGLVVDPRPMPSR